MSEYLKAPSGPPLFIHIAAGVALGIVAASFVIWQYWQWQMRTATAEAAATLKAAAQSAQIEQQKQADSARQAEAAERAKAAATQRAVEAHRSARAANAAAEEMRRDQAWARFYKKPAACDESRGGSWTVDCANDFIKARKTFQERYEAGKL